MKRSQVPNVLTILRGFSAFVFPFVAPPIRLPLFVFASLTEFFDGYLARRWNATSRAGRILDPAADKLFAISVGVTLILSGKLTAALLALVLVRDLAIVAGAAVILALGLKQAGDFRPRGLGKWATAFQYAYFLALLLGGRATGPLFFATLSLSAAAALDYAAFVLETGFHQPVR